MIRWVYTFDAFFFEIVIDVWSIIRPRFYVYYCNFLSWRLRIFSLIASTPVSGVEIRREV